MLLVLVLFSLVFIRVACPSREAAAFINRPLNMKMYVRAYRLLWYNIYLLLSASAPDTLHLKYAALSDVEHAGSCHAVNPVQYRSTDAVPMADGQMCDTELYVPDYNTPPPGGRREGVQSRTVTAVAV